MRPIQNLSRLAVRGFNTSVRKATTAEPLGPGPKGVIPASKGYEKVLKIQKLAYKNPDVLVWRLFGMRDAILYNFTLFISATAAVAVSIPLWRLIFPKKKE
ncbi:hypothetical protein LSH36_351g02058 [Paralvinella palmiformis]|uniref:Uncharacterized protein n=1 Tax=Paralvinella palmiformis TaxID=53620 RepID=A0AAD9JGK5_9ANNE|nr:hypothetical protein LSH36_351g02058 [Paralvinella palmiformis]